MCSVNSGTVASIRVTVTTVSGTALLPTHRWSKPLRSVFAFSLSGIKRRSPPVVREARGIPAGDPDLGFCGSLEGCFRRDTQATSCCPERKWLPSLASRKANGDHRFPPEKAGGGHHSLFREAGSKWWTRLAFREARGGHNLLSGKQAPTRIMVWCVFVCKFADGAPSQSQLAYPRGRW